MTDYSLNQKVIEKYYHEDRKYVKVRDVYKQFDCNSKLQLISTNCFNKTTKSIVLHPPFLNKPPPVNVNSHLKALLDKYRFYDMNPHWCIITKNVLRIFYFVHVNREITKIFKKFSENLINP